MLSSRGLGQNVFIELVFNAACIPLGKGFVKTSFGSTLAAAVLPAEDGFPVDILNPYAYNISIVIVGTRLHDAKSI